MTVLVPSRMRLEKTTLLTHQVANIHDIGTLDGRHGMPRSCGLVQDF